MLNGIPYTPVSGDFSLKGKVAVVVGGAGGIGGASAEMYAKKGAKVAIVDIKDTVEQVAEELAAKYQTEAIGLKCDLTQAEQIGLTVQKVVERFGEINILLNSGGYVFLDDAEKIDFSEVEKQIKVNLFGPFHMSQAVANQMIRQGKGGKIVCITSQADFIAIDKHVGYTMSKAALVGMIKVMALEWAEYGINVNGVAPTVVHTYMGERAWQGKVKEDMLKKIPVHRFAEPDEIAAAVLFMSCDESNMVTGEDLVVDGGFTIY